MSSPVNFHWLKNDVEKKHAIDLILTAFKARQIATQESVETIVERIMEDDDANSACGVIRGFENLCAQVWRDDLTSGGVGELELPDSCLLAMIERDGELIIAKPSITLMAGDDIAIIGEPEDIQSLGT